MTETTSTPTALDQELRDLLVDSEVVTELKQKQQRKRLAERRQLAKQLREFEQDDNGIPEQIKALETAKGEREAAYTRYQELLSAERREQLSLMQLRSRRERQINRLRDKLVETADPAIDAVADALSEAEDRLMKRGAIESSTAAGERDLVNQTRGVVTYTNAPAVKAALAYIRKEARPKLAALKLQPAVKSEELQAIRDGVPDTSELTTIEGTKRTAKED